MSHTSSTNAQASKTGRSLRADGHVHIYNCYDSSVALQSAARNLRSAHAPSSQDELAIFLTERSDCDFFAKLSGEEATPEVKRVSDLWVFAGRQLATRERMEVLALGTRQTFSDGLAFEEALRKVQEAGAIPVIPWSPGKWMFGRAHILGSVLERAKPGDLLLADSSLRPIGWPQPAFFEMARERGIGILAGSDPLPFAEQEPLIGSFGFRLASGFDPAAPLDSVRKCLLAPAPSCEVIGKRLSILGVLSRLYCNRAARR
ncbi:MAG: hypothetical protein J0M12_13955 [Deltaproteobacteria bacterium]|nr:hypothetical protein [Deltaproteobacteria bacterium]